MIFGKPEFKRHFPSHHAHKVISDRLSDTPTVSEKEQSTCTKLRMIKFTIIITSIDYLYIGNKIGYLWND